MLREDPWKKSQVLPTEWDVVGVSRQRPTLFGQPLRSYPAGPNACDDKMALSYDRSLDVTAALDWLQTTSAEGGHSFHWAPRRSRETEAE